MNVLEELVLRINNGKRLVCYLLRTELRIIAVWLGSESLIRQICRLKITASFVPFTFFIRACLLL